MPKSIENTVFVRFVPTPHHKVMRHQLEDIFSQMGPIKKSSWINAKPARGGGSVHENRNNTSSGSKGYGFIKYVVQEDAEAAMKELNNSKIEMEGNNYTLKVELASLTVASNSNKNKGYDGEKKRRDVGAIALDGQCSEDTSWLKKRSRIIVRNLSFYAKENHIQKVMESNYGKVSDVHLPKVQNNLHVGFCFVTSGII